MHTLLAIALLLFILRELDKIPGWCWLLMIVLAPVWWLFGDLIGLLLPVILAVLVAAPFVVVVAAIPVILVWAVGSTLRDVFTGRSPRRLSRAEEDDRLTAAVRADANMARMRIGEMPLTFAGRKPVAPKHDPLNTAIVCAALFVIAMAGLCFFW